MSIRRWSGSFVLDMAIGAGGCSRLGEQRLELGPLDQPLAGDLDGNDLAVADHLVELRSPDSGGDHGLLDGVGEFVRVACQLSHGLLRQRVVQAAFVLLGLTNGFVSVVARPADRLEGIAGHVSPAVG